MSSSPPPPPDRFSREIDDIIRLAEKRLERQSLGGRARRQVRSFRAFQGARLPRLPAAETLGGWGLALLLISWLLSLIGAFLPFGALLGSAALAAGLVCLIAALVLSLTRGRSGVGSGGGGGARMWRGERMSYGSPYGGGGLMRRLRRLFPPRR